MLNTIYTCSAKVRQPGYEVPTEQCLISVTSRFGPYLFHRDDGPAQVVTDLNRIVHNQYWYLGHLLAIVSHRDGLLMDAVFAEDRRFIAINKHAPKPLAKSGHPAILQLLTLAKKDMTAFKSSPTHPLLHADISRDDTFLSSRPLEPRDTLTVSALSLPKPNGTGS